MASKVLPICNDASVIFTHTLLLGFEIATPIETPSALPIVSSLNVTKGISSCFTPIFKLSRLFK